jgi:adenosylcobinamide-GDP ribazoletransferase
MKLVRRFLAAASFLTRLPVPANVQLDEVSLAESPPMFPLVGAIIGLVTAGFDRLACALFHPAVAAVGDLMVVFGLTGGLHLDGLLDSADGLLSGKSREKALDIMKDSRVGAMGVSAGILVIGLKITLIAVLAAGARFKALLIAPLLGRHSMLVAMTLFPYARPEEGLGSLFKAKAGPRWLLIPGLFVTAVTIVAAGQRGAAALFLSVLLAMVLGRWASARLGGLTGDVYGALCEITEAAVLAVFAARW